MNKLEITGIITQILEVQTGEKKDGSGKWEKQNFILDTGTQYNNIYFFEVFGDQKVDNFKKLNKVGQEVTVEFNVNTNEYKEKFYTTLSAWKIMATSTANQFQPQQPHNSFADETKTNPKESYKGKQEFTQHLGQDDEPDDLPF